MGRDVDDPVVTGSAFSLGNERSPLYGASSGEPVRPDPLLSEEELTEIRLRDIAFGDAEELGWS